MIEQFGRPGGPGTDAVSLELNGFAGGMTWVKARIQGGVKGGSSINRNPEGYSRSMQPTPLARLGNVGGFVGKHLCQHGHPTMKHRGPQIDLCTGWIPDSRGPIGHSIGDDDRNPMRDEARQQVTHKAGLILVACTHNTTLGGGLQLPGQPQPSLLMGQRQGEGHADEHEGEHDAPERSPPCSPANSPGGLAAPETLTQRQPTGTTDRTPPQAAIVPHRPTTAVLAGAAHAKKPNRDNLQYGEDP